MNKQSLSAYISLASAGLLAGVLTVVFSSLNVLPGWSEPFYPGAIFGLVIAGYFVAFHGLRTIWKALGFAVMSILAYYSAFFATGTPPFHVRLLDFPQHGLGFIPTGDFFMGGAVGAAILFGGFFLFLSPQQQWEQYLKALAFSLVAGLLAVFAFTVGNQIAFRLTHVDGSDWDVNSLYIVWQTGVACMFAFLLPHTASPSATAATTLPDAS